ncbi:MAG TPA: two-component regulator propeller domain-containing protein [Cyclobacteriaceae bacterium]
MLIVGVLAMSRFAVAQDVHYSIRSYTAIDGLPQSQVTGLAEDANGYLWIGTQGGGLARFDGREFKVYTTLDGLLSNFINGLAFDSHQNLWLLHPNGLTRYDGLSFTKFQAPVDDASPLVLRRMTVSGDDIYVLNAQGTLGKISGDSVQYWSKPVLDQAAIFTMHKGPGGEILFYLSTGTIHVFDGAERYSIAAPTKSRGVNFFNFGNEVRVRLEGKTFRIDLASKRLEPLPQHIPNFVLYYDTRDNTYWTRDEHNLYRCHVTDTGYRLDTIARDVEVILVLPDSDQNVWLATDGSGLLKYYFEDFERLGPDDMRGVMAIYDNGAGEMWIGTMSKGVWRLRNGTFTPVSISEDPMRNMIHAIKSSPSGEVWMTTANGLAHYDRTRDRFTWYTREQGLSANNVRCMSFDEKGGMWIATPRGVEYFDGSAFTHYSRENGLSGAVVWSLCYLPVWKTVFVGNDSGVDAIREGQVSSLSIPEVENTMIFNINPYRDSLVLIGSGGAGVVVYHPGTGERKSLTTRDGLISDFVYFVVSDEDDNIWIGTEKGISRIRLNDRLEIVESLSFDHENGLTGIETNQNAFFIRGDLKYFGLIDGLYKYNDVNKASSQSFALHMTDVEILYGEYSARDYTDSLMGFFKIPVQPALPSDKNHITFHFNRVDKRYPKSVKFVYYLQNFDKTWSQASSATQVTYSNLPPGRYVFRVMATDQKGGWSNDRIAYAFTVRAPFYRMPSFIAGMVIFVAGSITLLLYLRVRQRVRKMLDIERIRMRELENLRKEIARDFHDEMGNQLTRIINYVSLLKLNGATSNGNGQHHDLYRKVEESAKFLYTGTRDFIWSIDPVNDELSKLFIHIRDFGEKLFEEKNICFRAHDLVKESIKLPNGYSREANLIFKEAMTNAFKYSGAQNVALTLRQEGDAYEMEFEDDGIGFHVENQKNSNGLKNIRERAERIGAQLRIHSEENRGSKITLAFRLTKKKKYGTAL